MANLHRIQAKLFLEEGTPVDLTAVVPVFHRWIQNQALGELLIDVANYAHVKDGPGLVLIGHEADYAVDLTHGRPGVLYTRKRDVPATSAEALSLALEQVLRAARLLEEEASLGFRFRTNELEIVFPDRLRLPNSEESLSLVRDDLVRVFAGIYGTDSLAVRRLETDARLPFGVSAEARVSPSLEVLLERLLTAAK